jgi:hypothetical protein
VVAANYADFEETIRFDNEKGYLGLGTYSLSAKALGLGYANVLTDRFSVGEDARYVRQLLAERIMSCSNGSVDR